MQTAATEVTQTSTSTFQMGTEPGASAPGALTHHPYGLCTPRRVFGSFATPQRTFSRVHLTAASAPRETRQTGAPSAPHGLTSFTDSPGVYA
jgi:hypothetical protein